MKWHGKQDEDVRSQGGEISIECPDFVDETGRCGASRTVMGEQWRKGDVSRGERDSWVVRHIDIGREHTLLTAKIGVSKPIGWNTSVLNRCFKKEALTLRNGSNRLIGQVGSHQLNLQPRGQQAPRFECFEQHG